MDLKMRITFEGKDYTFTVLTNGVNKKTRSIKISLEGQEYELVPNVRNEWNATDVTTNENPALLRAIARNVSLRYRL
jgi:hypothetical protein